VSRIADLKADGSTSSGCWIYAGVFANGENLSKRRDFKTDPGNLGIYPNFGWAWPNNMRVLYNRASCDRHGKPYPDTKPIVWWDEKAGRWTGYDIPDVPVMTDGPDTPNGLRAFHMNAEGVGRLFAAVYADPRPPSAQNEFVDAGQTPVGSETALDGMPRDTSYVPKDGPLPEMYEPVESPVENLLHPKVKSNPLLKYPRVKSHQPIGTVQDFPYVLMTSTVAEHWCAGSTTRNIPWLNELVPEPMIEMPISLAEKLSVQSGDFVKVSSARGDVTVKAQVTPRMKTLQSAGKEVTIVWMPYNWGFKGLSTGASVNHITIDAVDPGAGTQETKACLVNIVKVRDRDVKQPVPGGRRT
jgi:formate dehydrogenase major subunit